MKIICFIDNLGAGGAQRQLVGLAKMLNSRNYDVSVLYYQDNRFFEKELIDDDISTYLIPNSGNKMSLFKRIYSYIKKRKPDVVISYLESPSIIACFLRVLGQKFRLIVSERNTNNCYSLRDRFRFNLFRISDVVVPNSYSQQHFIEEKCSFLKSKIKTITNFCSFLDYKVERKTRREKPEIVVVASIWPPKNTINFIRAAKACRNKGLQFHVTWYGKVGETDYFVPCNKLIKDLDVADTISLLDKTTAIADVYKNADFFCLPSFYEGTPNVICEAICMSLPVICSDVCDNGIYVHRGENGFLFDPTNVEDIAVQLEKALLLKQNEYIHYCSTSRLIAEKYLSEKLFIQKYIAIIDND